jgi:DNA-binding CsgD family transcriptional regulator
MQLTHYLLHQAPLPSAGGQQQGRDIAFIVTEEGVARPLRSDLTRPENVSQTPPLAIEKVLGMRDPAHVSRLRVAVSQAINEGRAQVVMWRRSGAGALLVVRPGNTRDTAVVSLEPLEADTQQLDPKVLVDLFGLSPSEAEIAAALASDRSIGEIARQRTVGVETVRGQVKSLLRKMELNSQKQLVRILTRVAAVIG